MQILGRVVAAGEQRTTSGTAGENGGKIRTGTGGLTALLSSLALFRLSPAYMCSRQALDEKQGSNANRATNALVTAHAAAGHMHHRRGRAPDNLFLDSLTAGVLEREAVNDRLEQRFLFQTATTASRSAEGVSSCVPRPEATTRHSIQHGI